MIRPIVKWSYIKGAKGLSRAKAHINYIQYREGADRERGPRTFFNAGDKPVSGSFIKQRLDELEQRGVQIHKLVLSPGINSVDLETYTREMLSNLERSKGVDLEWYAVRHGNTAHAHTHVVIMGTDANGQTVQIRLADNHCLRDWGSKYLEREHELERYLDREIDQLLEKNRKTPELKYVRQRGDQEFERLIFGDQEERKEQSSEPQRNAVNDWQLFNEFLPGNSNSTQNFRPISYKQYQTESAGRLLDFHERFQTREMKEYWQNIQENFPELAGDAMRELQWIQSLPEQSPSMEEDFGFEKLLDGLDQIDRDVRKVAGPEAEYIRQTTRPEDIDHAALDRVFERFSADFEVELVRALREPIELIKEEHEERETSLDDIRDRTRDWRDEHTR